MLKFMIPLTVVALAMAAGTAPAQVRTPPRPVAVTPPTPRVVPATAPVAVSSVRATPTFAATAARQVPATSLRVVATPRFNPASNGTATFSRLEAHHMVPRSMGNNLRLGNPGLTLLGQQQHRQLHSAMRSYFTQPRFTRPHPDTGAAVNIATRAALNRGGSKPAFSVADRVRALDGFYRQYQGGRYVESFRRETGFAAAAKKLK